MQKLTVECAYFLSQYPNNIMVKIDEAYYLLPHNRKSNELSTFKKVDTDFAEKANKREFLNSDYFFNYLEKKSGYNIPLGRAISDKEFESLKAKLNLSEEDISSPFENSKGAIYGKSAKRYTCVQINVPDGMEIEIEQKLRQKGIEASNGSPNRVNIRVAI